MRAAVVVVNYGSSRLLADNLPALSGVPGVAVVVVDSLSSAAERTAARELAAGHGWTFVELPGNPGFGAAVGAGVARARADGAEQIVLLNPDATITVPVLEALVAAAREDDAALVCPVVEDAGGAVWFAGGELDLAAGVTRTRGVDVATAAHPWVTGACLAFSAELWDRVGGFDDRYFMYWEDIDLSHRVVALGGRVVVRSDLRAVHQVGGTQRGEGKSSLYCRYNCRNRLLFAALHVPGEHLGRWIRSAPRYGLRLAQRGGGRRALLRRPVPLLWSVLRGTAEGIALLVRLRLLGRGPASPAGSARGAAS
jgi:N-acetylglucosaminyl-diphospho-decaprenol L-rhamnosyltransferase